MGARPDHRRCPRKERRDATVKVTSRHPIPVDHPPRNSPGRPETRGGLDGGAPPPVDAHAVGTALARKGLAVRHAGTDVLGGFGRPGGVPPEWTPRSAGRTAKAFLLGQEKYRLETGPRLWGIRPGSSEIMVRGTAKPLREISNLAEDGRNMP